MSFLKNLFAGGVSGLVKTVADVADEFTLSPEEKAEFALRTQEVVAKQMEAIEESVQAQFQMVADVIKAEMASGSNYTKNARPTLVYWGMVLITLSIIPQIFGKPSIVLPEEFWYAWTGVVGLWIVGRSAERAGSHGKLTKTITGSDAKSEILDRLTK